MGVPGGWPQNASKDPKFQAELYVEDLSSRSSLIQVNCSGWALCKWIIH